MSIVARRLSCSDKKKKELLESSLGYLALSSRLRYDLGDLVWRCFGPGENVLEAPRLV
jgi:hypothetical protein